MKKFKEIWDACTIKFPMWFRITIVGTFIVIITLAITLPLVLKNNGNSTEQQEKDENVYLYEEITFADEIFIKCTGLNVIEDEDKNYTLNLKLNIEQWNTDLNVNQQKIYSDMFSLRLVDKDAKTPMSVFVNCLAGATASALISGAVGGDVNVIEETLSFATDYISESIENAVSNKEKTLKAQENQFEEFYPYLNNGISKTIELSFKLNDTFLNSTNTMVLSIDTRFRVEKNIFLILRPNTKNHTIELDLNGGVSSSLPNTINVIAGDITEIPTEIPKKEGYVFLFWTTEKDKMETKVRDFYFHPNQDNITFKVFAYYQELIPLDEFININEKVYFKDNTISASVSEYSYHNQIIVKSKKQDEVIINAPIGKKYLQLNIIINKTKSGNSHTLDNNDDFFLSNSDVSKEVSNYYGYEKFKKIKPIDDFSWIGLDINAIGTYKIVLSFEMNENWLLEEKLVFLELDFFVGPNSKSILLRSA